MNVFNNSCKNNKCLEDTLDRENQPMTIETDLGVKAMAYALDRKTSSFMPLGYEHGTL